MSCLNMTFCHLSFFYKITITYNEHSINKLQKPTNWFMCEYSFMPYFTQTDINTKDCINIQPPNELILD
ncbi:hypothetical protein GAB14E_2364 [Colwellia psychrerythraea]|uniref:Uncharacterized protein n=1 Tax=Colwellia psychrerythraea TaxID=28229 RepID=A0A099KSQ6_COLPS|nr:hypothetical protein GAB14E_2364 [Colwellia psychrerythraea]